MEAGREAVCFSPPLLLESCLVLGRRIALPEVLGLPDPRTWGPLGDSGKAGGLSVAPEWGGPLGAHTGSPAPRARHEAPAGDLGFKSGSATY